MKITYDDLQTIQKCALFALALDRGEASFLVVNGDYRADLHRDLAGSGWEFRIYEESSPEVNLGHGYGLDFPTVLKQAEMIIRVLVPEKSESMVS